MSNKVKQIIAQQTREHVIQQSLDALSSVLETLEEHNITLKNIDGKFCVSDGSLYEETFDTLPEACTKAIYRLADNQY